MELSMNKTVRKYFEQAGGTIEVCDVTRDEVLTYTDNFDPEKFTELIINRCADICEDIGTSGDGQVCVDAIRKAFV
jgi:hypothetical protein